jgi:hypothetical protein
MSRSFPKLITQLEPGGMRFDRLVWAIAAQYDRPVPIVQDWLMGKNEFEITALWYHINPLWLEKFYVPTLEHGAAQALADAIDSL